MRSRGIVVAVCLGLALLAPLGHHGAPKAEAQFDNLVSGIGSLLGLGGGDPVRIVADTSATSIKNTLETILQTITNATTAAGVTSLNLKEMVLDPIAWNMAKHLQQQLTGDLLKWLGGQAPGQNGQVPFIQNYSDYWSQLRDQVAGEFISGDKIGGLCSEEENFQVKQGVYYSYVLSRSNNGSMFQCSDGEEGNDGRSALDRMFARSLECSDVTCATYYADHKLATEEANAFANADKMTDISRGMLPQQVCNDVAVPLPNGSTTTNRRCALVNPLYLAGDTTSFLLAQMPGLQLLQIDEFSEIVSNLMSNLTNQALQGLTGVLGLSGNPNYSANVFGPNGSLSYVDALLQDNISSYQAPSSDPIKEALQAEQVYTAMQNTILDEIASIENKLAENRNMLGACFDMTLSDELEEAKAAATEALAISSTATAILTTLDNEYSAATDPGAKGAIMSTFVSYKNQNLFRTDYDNQQFRIMYLEITFAQLADIFRYDMALKRQSCGGDFDYDGVLASPQPPETP